MGYSLGNGGLVIFLGFLSFVIIIFDLFNVYFYFFFGVCCVVNGIYWLDKFDLVEIDWFFVFLSYCVIYFKKKKK